MNWQRVAHECEVAENLLEILGPYYDRAQETYAGTPFFLEENFIRTYLPLVEAPTDILDRALQVAADIRDNEVLMRHAWFIHCKCYRLANAFASTAGWGVPRKLMGENAGMFVFLLALSALPLIEEAQKRLGFPRECFLGAARWIGGTVGIYQMAHDGIPGTTETQIHWLRHSIDGNLVRIGRFEYMTNDAGMYLPAIFRNKYTGEIRALAQDNWTFYRDGSRLWSGGETGVNAPFTARLTEDGEAWTGTPIAPTGYALTDRRVSLFKTDWEKAQKPGELTPGLHIPGGGRMTPEAARTSFIEARDFYLKYYGRKVSMFICQSWIFDPQLIMALPESNMAKLMKQLYLFPVPGPKMGGAFFLFGRSDVDYETENGKTSVQKAYIDLVRSKRYPRVGGMFVMADDLEYFGTDFYRNNQHRG